MLVSMASIADKESKMRPKMQIFICNLPCHYSLGVITHAGARSPRPLTLGARQGEMVGSRSLPQGATLIFGWCEERRTVAVPCPQNREEAFIHRQVTDTLVTTVNVTGAGGTKLCLR